MRPKPSEIIAGIRTILAETIAPELTGDHAASRLSEIRAVLAQVDWDDAGFTLKARTIQLRAALHDASDWVIESVPELPEVETFATYQQNWEVLGRCVIGALDRLDAHLDEFPDDAAAESCRRGLLAAL